MQLLNILLSYRTGSTGDFTSASNIKILTSVRLETNVNIWISLHFKFASGKKRGNCQKMEVSKTTLKLYMSHWRSKWLRAGRAPGATQASPESCSSAHGPGLCAHNPPLKTNRTDSLRTAWGHQHHTSKLLTLGRSS